MTENQKVLDLRQQLNKLGKEFVAAQLDLENTVQIHGLGAPEALEASNLCGHLAIQFSVVEEEYLSIMGGGSRWHLTSRS